MVWNVHAAEVAAGISAVHDMAVGEDVGESTFLAELAVSLFGQSVTIHRLLQYSCPDLMRTFCCRKLLPYSFIRNRKRPQPSVTQPLVCITSLGSQASVYITHAYLVLPSSFPPPVSSLLTGFCRLTSSSTAIISHKTFDHFQEEAF